MNAFPVFALIDLVCKVGAVMVLVSMIILLIEAWHERAVQDWMIILLALGALDILFQWSAGETKLLAAILFIAGFIIYIVSAVRAWTQTMEPRG